MISATALQSVSLRKVQVPATRPFISSDEVKSAVSQERTQNARLRAVDLECWYFALAQFTFKTEFIPLSPEEARAIVQQYHVLLHSESASSPSSSLPSSTSVTDQHLSSLLSKISQTISSLSQASQSTLPDSKPFAVFAKLSSRSPKDSRLCEACALQSICDELLALSSDGQAVDANTIQRVVMRAGIQSLRHSDAASVLESFLTSDRVCEDDLPLALSFPDRWSQHIVIREWIDIPTYCEFRGFVFNGKLTAVSQYFVGVHFPELIQHEQTILALIQQLFEEMKHLVPVQPAEYVLDIAVDLEHKRAFVIELNPFGRPDGLGTGCCLFKCNDPRDAAILFGEAPFEFRIQREEAAIDLRRILREGPLKQFLISHHFIQPDSSITRST